MTDALDVDELRELLPSWLVYLRALRRSEQTVRAYSFGVGAYLDYCAAHSVPPLRRGTLSGWTNALLTRGNSPATARTRQLAVRQYTKWLADEQEIPTDPLVGVKPPKLDEPVVEPLTDDELRAMIKACTPPKGTDRTQLLRYRRDEAILRLMVETGMRAGELVALGVDDIGENQAIVRRGKGGKGRLVPFGPQTALAIDRYTRIRKGHRLADTPPLWLGDRGKGFSYAALFATLRTRAATAGVEGFHPHRLRHTAAHRWLAAGGTEGGLMTVAGWTRPDMLMRYTRAQAASRAADEAKSLNLGDL